MSWRFGEMAPGDLNVDPIENEFFANESLEGITAALVREAIQNSLDAAVEETVRVRFVLGQADAAAGRRYLADLVPHVEAAAEPGAQPPRLDSGVRFLAVEDEGTRGLEGDPNQYEDDDGEKPRNDFYYFWRNVGRSRKESTDRGRWGLGKTVFAAASRLGAFFGLTVRRSDQRALLMGQAVLRIHRVGSRRYRPYGYYGHYKNGLPMPLEGAREVKEFRQSFALRRKGPGFSAVVCEPDEEITRDGLAEAVLSHYFHPLMSGRLEVEIEADGEPPVVLRREGLETGVRRWEKSRRLLPVIELARWGREPDPEAVVEIAAPTMGEAPRLTEDLFAAADLEKLRRRFDAGRPIAIDAKVFIEPKSGAAREAGFRLLMERDPDQGRGQGYFVRQGITIENGRAKRPRGVRWILIVDDGTLSSFLGDAENPAHTEWQRSSRKFEEDPGRRRSGRSGDERPARGCTTGSASGGVRRPRGPGMGPRTRLRLAAAASESAARGDPGGGPLRAGVPGAGLSRGVSGDSDPCPARGALRPRLR